MGRPLKYPWDDWLATKESIHVDLTSPDVDVDLKTLQTQVYAEARRRGVPITTRACSKGHLRYSYRLDREVMVKGECLIIAPGAKRRRNWDAILDGRPHPFWYSELSCSPESFVRLARMMAKERGLSVRVDRRTNKGGLMLQAVPRRG